MVYDVPEDPAQPEWPAEVADSSLHTIHNLQLIDLNGDGRDEVVVAAWEGVFVLERNVAGKWTRSQVGRGNQESSPSKGSSEVKVGRLQGGGSYIATIEPWHGYQVVVYTPPAASADRSPDADASTPGARAPAPLWSRTVIAEPVQWGHAVWCANLDDDGDDELIIGQRDANKPGTPAARAGRVRVRSPAGRRGGQADLRSAHDRRRRRWLRGCDGCRSRRRRSRRYHRRGPVDSQRPDLLESPGRVAMTGRWCVLAAAVLWSTGGAISKALELDPLTIAFYRGLFAGLALVPFVPRGERTFRLALWPLGVAFGVMVGCFLGAVKITTSANAILLQCTSALWVVPLSALLLHERPDRRARVSIAMAVLGIVAIVGWGYDGRPREWQGIALGLGSGVLSAGIGVGLRRLRGLDPMWLSAALNLVGTAALGLWAWASGQGLGSPSGPQWLVLVAFGVFQMAIPYTLYARGLREISAAEASLIALVEPILNPIWVVLFVHERPAGPTLIGGLFLLAGLVYRYWPALAGIRHEPAVTRSE